MDFEKADEHVQWFDVGGGAALVLQVRAGARRGHAPLPRSSRVWRRGWALGDPAIPWPLTRNPPTRRMAASSSTTGRRRRPSGWPACASKTPSRCAALPVAAARRREEQGVTDGSCGQLNCVASGCSCAARRGFRRPTLQCPDATSRLRRAQVVARDADGAALDPLQAHAAAVLQVVDSVTGAVVSTIPRNAAGTFYQVRHGLAVLGKAAAAARMPVRGAAGRGSRGPSADGAARLADPRTRHPCPSMQVYPSARKRHRKPEPARVQAMPGAVSSRHTH